MKNLHLFTLLFLVTLAIQFTFADEVVYDEQPTLEVIPMSLIDYENRQRIDFKPLALKEPVAKATMEVWQDGQCIYRVECHNLKSHEWSSIMVPEAKESKYTFWKLVGEDSQMLGRTADNWNPPRHWTFYIHRSSHIDIGLHDSQFIQRKLVCDYYDQAAANVEKYKDYPEASRFRWFHEGQWIWENYCKEKSPEYIKEFVDKYIRTGLLGVGAYHAGNHTQEFSKDELCRSVYYKRNFLKQTGIDLDTMVMVDNPGMTWPLVDVLADAGIQNILFSPNQWNQLAPGPARIPTWGKNNPKSIGWWGLRWNPDCGGGGARIDVAWDSEYPMVFYWLGPDEKSKVLILSTPQYPHPGKYFGVGTGRRGVDIDEVQLREFLPKLEKRYPYDLWIAPFYQDNEGPGSISEGLTSFNKRWKYPIYRTVGDLSEPFHILREKFGDKIPTLRGDLSNSWAQHTMSAPNLMAKKFTVDRKLSTAQTFATIAALVDKAYLYPADELERAWDCIICNDEHSFAVEGLPQGRKFYETQAQHQDWVDRADGIAESELNLALSTIAKQVKTTQPGVLLFNPTLKPRTVYDSRFEKPVEVPSLGYAFISEELGVRSEELEKQETKAEITQNTGENDSDGNTSTPHSSLLTPNSTPPVSSTNNVVENAFYRLTVAENGTISSLFDKELNRELVDQNCEYKLNQHLYTPDAYKTFVSPEKPEINVTKTADAQIVTVVYTSCENILRTRKITSIITLPNNEKRIDFDNRFEGMYGVFNKNYDQHYIYTAFPFAVPQTKYYASLNGCVVTPHDDQLGIAVEAFCSPRDWATAECDSENPAERFGVALIQKDTQVLEFGKIHSNKRSYNDHPKTGHIYSALLNTWLQKENAGGDTANSQFRYSIVSYKMEPAQPGWRTVGLEAIAKAINNPVLEIPITQAQPNGTLPENSFSFLTVDNPNVELLSLKIALPDGIPQAPLSKLNGENTNSQLPQFARFTPGTSRGIVARFHETSGQVSQFKLTLNVGSAKGVKDCTILEEDKSDVNLQNPISLGKYEFKTLRFPENPIACRPIPDIPMENGVADVGAYHTGLIEKPVACITHETTSLYFLWGVSYQPELSHYELYRLNPDGETWTQLPNVQPGPFRVVRAGDSGLQPDTKYTYRVRAVNKDGAVGRFSTFEGVTKSAK